MRVGRGRGAPAAFAHHVEHALELERFAENLGADEAMRPVLVVEVDRHRRLVMIDVGLS